MADLTNQKIKDTYKYLCQVSTGIDATLRNVSDGEGTSSALQISTTGVKSTGTFAVTGASTFTGSVSFGSPINVSNGGTGAATLTGILVGNGTSAITGVTTSAAIASALSDETGSGALVFANTPTFVTPILGTPTSGTLTSCTGLPVSTGISGLGTGVATFLATPSSANLASAVTNETGSGALVFGTTPTLATPVINGTITGTTVIPVANGGTGLAVSNPIAQRVSTLTGAVLTGATTLPADDTIPQNTEGDQYMSLAITPKNSANILVIDVMFSGANSAGTGYFGVALFQDSTASALAASLDTLGANHGRMIKLRHIMTAGTTSATTFKVRAGNSTAGTTTFNGVSSGRIYGGIMASSISITEYTT